MKNAIVNLLLVLSLGWLKAIAWLLGAFLRLLLLFRPIPEQSNLGRHVQGEQR